MQHWCKSGLFGLSLGLFSCCWAAHTWADAAPAKTEKGEKMDDQAGKINIAIPVHQPVKGIHLPFYDLTGKMKMQFDATTANRTSENMIDMTELKIETFDDKGKRDMLVQFPAATYDLSSSIISTKGSVEVRRTDFVLTGVGMEFDTKHRAGRVFSQIRMEIFNRQTETAPPATSPSPTPNGP